MTIRDRSNGGVEKRICFSFIFLDGNQFWLAVPNAWEKKPKEDLMDDSGATPLLPQLLGLGLAPAGAAAMC